MNHKTRMRIVSFYLIELKISILPRCVIVFNNESTATLCVVNFHVSHVFARFNLPSVQIKTWNAKGILHKVHHVLDLITLCRCCRFILKQSTSCFPTISFTIISVHSAHSENIHYNEVIMSAMASLITSLTSVYSTVHPGADQRKHQSPASLAFAQGIHRRPVNSPHKWPVTRKMFPFGDVIMVYHVWQNH